MGTAVPEVLVAQDAARVRILSPAAIQARGFEFKGWLAAARPAPAGRHLSVQQFPCLDETLGVYIYISQLVVVVVPQPHFLSKTEASLVFENSRCKRWLVCGCV